MERIMESVVPVSLHCVGNYIFLVSNTVLLLSNGSIHPFLFQRHLLLFRLSRAWRQSFAIGVSDLNIFSPLSSIFDNCASISSDESPYSDTVLS